ncbi:MAG: SBBP repeat-containing protein [bacterium]|nr:SBBP repeat-containing protein [bacterium]
MKIFPILMLLTLMFNNVNSQQEWVVRYNGPGNNTDVAKAITVDASGNTYVAGYSLNSGTSYDYVTVKYTANGNQAWVSAYNGLGNDLDYATAIAIDNNGNVYVTGYSFSSSSSYDYATVKYNSSGIQQWAVTYNGFGNAVDLAKTIKVDDLGNVYVTGQSYGGSSTSYDFATVKYSSTGNQLWASRYDGSSNGNDGANSMVIDANYNVYVTGQSVNTGSSQDFETIKYNSAGVEQWSSSYNGSANDIDVSHCIQVDNSGNVYVTGYSRGNGNYDYVTAKYDSLGVSQWASRFNGNTNSNDYPTALAVDPNGNVYITGVINSDANGSAANYATLKYNPTGTIAWATAYNGPANGNDSATALVLDDSNNVYVTGKSTGQGSGFDYATVKYNNNGAQTNISRFNGPANGNDVSNSVALDNQRNIYVTGSSSNGFTDDYATIKYFTLSGIQSIGNVIPSEFKLSQNYPNPFNPSTTIRFSLPVYSDISLKVYDIKGQEISKLADGSLQAGNYEVTFDASLIPSGIYFYKLVTPSVTITKKMTLLK